MALPPRSHCWVVTVALPLHFGCMASFLPRLNRRLVHRHPPGSGCGPSRSLHDLTCHTEPPNTSVSLWNFRVHRNMHPTRTWDTQTSWVTKVAPVVLQLSGQARTSILSVLYLVGLNKILFGVTTKGFLEVILAHQRIRVLWVHFAWKMLANCESKKPKPRRPAPRCKPNTQAQSSQLLDESSAQVVLGGWPSWRSARLMIQAARQSIARNCFLAVCSQKGGHVHLTCDGLVLSEIVHHLTC